MNGTNGNTFSEYLEGIYFDDRIEALRSEIYHFLSIVNPKGILMSFLDDDGRFREEISLNPGETREVSCVEKCEQCKKRKILIGLINKFDEQGNVKSEYFTGFVDESKTIIITKGEEDFKVIKKYQNPGPTREITVKI
ncbi:MAG: hypothetical protein WA063_00360 [Minisyncoccia bacterium]